MVFLKISQYSQENTCVGVEKRFLKKFLRTSICFDVFLEAIEKSEICFNNFQNEICSVYIMLRILDNINDKPKYLILISLCVSDFSNIQKLRVLNISLMQLPFRVRLLALSYIAIILLLLNGILVSHIVQTCKNIVVRS